MNILVTGGSGSGKSRYALQLASSLPGPRTYVAAMRPFAPDSAEKIARHRRLRAEMGFSGTAERYTDLAGLELPPGGTALVECLCNLTSNEMFSETGEVRDPVPAVLAGLERLAAQCGDLITVTNDAASGGVPPETADYLRALEEINRAAAERFDAAVELVCGIPLLLKGPAGLIAPPEPGDTGLTLIVGPAGGGKRTYAESLGYAAGDFSEDPDDSAPVLTGLETLMDRESESVEALLPRLLKKQVILCGEVGCGVIPADWSAHLRRRQTGRLCILLARRADRVVRVRCGLPQILKAP